MLRTKVVETKEIHILRPIYFLLSPALFEIIKHIFGKVQSMPDYTASHVICTSSF
jgi:hypothetical protein